MIDAVATAAGKLAVAVSVATVSTWAGVLGAAALSHWRKRK